MKITRVEVNGFWQTENVDLSFGENVNILIGRNGTGKTHLLNIIHSVLTVNTRSLSRLEFKEVKIHFLHTKKEGHLIVRKNTERTVESFSELGKNYKLTSYSSLEYTFDNKKYIIVDSYVDSSIITADTNLISTEELRGLIEAKFKVVLLNVSRNSAASKPTTPNDNRDSIEKRIYSILQRLSNNQVRLSESNSKLSREIEKSILASLLFDETSSNYDINVLVDFDVLLSKKRVVDMFKDLGFLDSTIKKKINFMYEQLEQMPDTLIEYPKLDSRKLQSVVPQILSWINLINRINKLIDIYTNAEEEKAKIWNKWNKYSRILNEFIIDKTFDFDKNGEYSAFKKKRRIPISLLSSGEKQVFLMLSEAYLESDSPHIFIADEPELSLHPEWQERIVENMYDLNPSAQYIIVTHSPEIAGGFPKNIIKMESVFK